MCMIASAGEILFLRTHHVEIEATNALCNLEGTIVLVECWVTQRKVIQIYGSSHVLYLREERGVWVAAASC